MAESDEPADKPKRNGHRPPNDEYEERIDYARHLIALRKVGSTYKQAMRARFGDISARQLQEILSRARALILEGAAVGRAMYTADGIAFYNEAISNAKDWRDKIKAQERIDKLLGLEFKQSPLESFCEHIGCTVDQLRQAIANVGGGSVPGATPVAPEATDDV